MSIYVFITRRDDPLDDSGPRISISEWQRQLKSDPEFRLPTDDEIDELGPSDEVSFAAWLAHPSNEPSWFAFADGNIEVKNPDSHILRKMASIAETMRARVVSEAGETFDSSGNSLGLPSEPAKANFLQGVVAWFRGK